MVGKTFTRNKLNSEKGVTGVDIVVSVTMIVITIAVVMAIFVNISSTSREVNRTSGATRMATNVLENIELMYYEDFIKYLKETLVPKTYTLNGTTYRIYTENDPAISDYNGTYLIPGEHFASEKFFETKIPNGYTLKLVISNVYGETEPSKYDLVRKVDVSVLFDVSGREKEVSLSTTKTFEKLETLYNKHAIEEKYFQGLIGDKLDAFRNNGMIYVEELSTGNEYRISSDMPTSYYYGETSSKPIMMIFNNSTYINGTNVISNKLSDIYVWIPSLKINTGVTPNKIVYEYQTHGITRTIVKKKNAIDGLETSFFTVNKYDTVDGYGLGFKADDNSRLEGVWISVNTLETASVNSTIKSFWENFVDTKLNDD